MRRFPSAWLLVVRVILALSLPLICVKVRVPLEGRTNCGAGSEGSAAHTRGSTDRRSSRDLVTGSRSFQGADAAVQIFGFEDPAARLNQIGNLIGRGARPSAPRARSTTGRAREARATQGTTRKVIKSLTQSLTKTEFNRSFHFELPDPNALIPNRHRLFDHHHDFRSILRATNVVVRLG